MVSKSASFITATSSDLANAMPFKPLIFDFTCSTSCPRNAIPVQIGLNQQCSDFVGFAKKVSKGLNAFQSACFNSRKSKTVFLIFLDTNEEVSQFQSALQNMTSAELSDLFPRFEEVVSVASLLQENGCAQVFVCTCGIQEIVHKYPHFC